MHKNCLVIIFFGFAVLKPFDNHEQKVDRLGQVKGTLEVVNAGVTVVKATALLGQKIKSQVYPSQEEQYRTAIINRKLCILQAQKELAQCLVAHAQEKREGNQLPCACKNFADSYAAVAGFKQLNAITSEFIHAVDEFDFSQRNEINQHVGMSTQKKILIGVVVVGGVGLAVVAAPVVFPGTVVAAKATAISASVKSFCAAVGTKITASGIVAKDAIMQTAYTLIDSGSSIMQMQLAGNIIMKAEMAQRFIESSQEIIYQTPEEELIKLKVSLAERMKAAYAQKCKE